MTIRVPIRLTDKDVAASDASVAAGRFANRSEALRAGLERLLDEERENQIDAGYRRGKRAQEDWVGELSLAGLTVFDRAEGDDPL